MSSLYTFFSNLSQSISNWLSIYVRSQYDYIIENVTNPLSPGNICLDFALLIGSIGLLVGFVDLLYQQLNKPK